MMVRRAPNRRSLPSWVLPGLAFLVVGLFRLPVLDQARFTGDEAYFWATARSIAVGGFRPLYGPPVTGSAALHPGPAFYYLMALPQLFGASPWQGSAFVAGLHGLGAACFFVWARTWASSVASGVAVLLLSVSPWASVYGDRIWLSCVTPVWAMVTLMLAGWALREDRWARSAQAGTVAMLVLGPQFHLSAPLIAVVVVVWWWKRRSALRGGAAVVGVGLLLGLLGYAPTLWHELCHGFEQYEQLWRNQAEAATLPSPGWTDALRALLYPVLFATAEIGFHFARGYWQPVGEVAMYVHREGAAAWLARHGWGEGALVLWSVAISVWAWAGALKGALLRGAAGDDRMHRAGGGEGREEARPYRAIVVALGAGIGAAVLLLGLLHKGFYPHYVNTFLFPAFLPLALGWDRIWGRGAVGRGLAITSLIGVFLGMGLVRARYYRTVDALNGLGPTRAMVARYHELARSARLRFRDFDNTFAWRMLARYEHGVEWGRAADAPVCLEVDNSGAVAVEAPGPDVEAFGPVWVRIRDGGP